MEGKNYSIFFMVFYLHFSEIFSVNHHNYFNVAKFGHYHHLIPRKSLQKRSHFLTININGKQTNEKKKSLQSFSIDVNWE